MFTGVLVLFSLLESRTQSVTRQSLCYIFGRSVRLQRGLKEGRKGCVMAAVEIL